MFTDDSQDEVLNDRSCHITKQPPAMIRITPGNNFEKGASSKKNHPMTKETGIPKYWNGERLLGSVSLYAETQK